MVERCLLKQLVFSQLIYTAFMLSVPETVIKNTQALLFNFLWRNKNDKEKRDVIYQPVSEGGLNFPNFRIMVQSLRLAWLSRLLSDTNDTIGRLFQITILINTEAWHFFLTAITIPQNLQKTFLFFIVSS